MPSVQDAKQLLRLLRKSKNLKKEKIHNTGSANPNELGYPILIQHPSKDNLSRYDANGLGETSFHFPVVDRCLV